MKKCWVLLSLLLLLGCSSKETVETEYFNSNHNEIVKDLLGEPLRKDETSKIFDESEAIDVYYDWVDEKKITLTIVNNMDYYYTGTVNFEVCPYSVSTMGLAPNGYASATIECPEFIEDGDFTYNGTLFERKEEHQYNVGIETYYYEDNDTLFDYVLDLEKITSEDIKKLADYLYTESVMMNYEDEMNINIYPKDAYDKAYETNTEEAWNELDKNYYSGRIWLDANSDFAEMYDAKDKLIERLNYR